MRAMQWRLLAATVAAQSAVAAQAEAPPARVMAVETASGASWSGLVHERQRLGGRWVLRFKREQGLRIDGRPVDAPVGADAFAEALDAGLRAVAGSGGTVDAIQVDALLVRETRADWVAAVKRAAARQTGAVGARGAVDRAVSAALAETAQVRRSCAVAQRYGWRCADPAVATDPVVYRREVFGQPWARVAAEADAGLAETVWFEIRVRRP
ncbi:hypothetical protein ABU614_01735 [Lysobacter firmicutimachus]|uniref:DUF541 domain-containing protein n=1 Tax=Lysobacter firmicutimachus TaxID=1792846 RepID=A0AAU8MV27_9GAMM